MTDNKMTPEQFVREWLPEYLKRRAYFYLYETTPCRPMFLTNKKIERRFVEHYFDKALAAYADHIRKEACERQREKCADAATTKEIVTGIGAWEEIDRDSILNAPAPEFKIKEKI